MCLYSNMLLTNLNIVPSNMKHTFKLSEQMKYYTYYIVINVTAIIVWLGHVMLIKVKYKI